MKSERALMTKCLVCFAPLASGHESAYHNSCARTLFESTKVPAIDLDMNALPEAGLKLLRSSGTVPGVQKKLSVDYNSGDVLCQAKFPENTKHASRKTPREIPGFHLPGFPSRKNTGGTLP